ncbi:MAG: serine/threonine-protein kinase, partial [Gemmatimonadota bacterium]
MVDLEATIRSSLDDRYVIESELGAGAMAVVFLAHDLKHDRNVAIKVLKPELASAIGGDRFQREIEVVAGLTHPHILPLYDSGEAAGLLYFVMPYIEGESLRGRLKREGRLPVRDAIRITREIADALGFAHRHGIIHRDVKPGNILLTEHHARLADFGIAHLAETEGGTLTGTGLALGTPAYFSPEQATGDRDLDGRSDVYSLGCVLYEALTGQPPFTATSVRALITHHIVDAPPQVKELRPEVSEGIEAVVQTALRKEPEKRFQTAEEMAGSLDLISGGFEAIAAAALRKLIGPRHKWLHGKRLAVLVAAAVMVLAAGVFTVWSVVRGPGFSRTVATYMLVPSSGGGATVREVEIAERAVRTLYFQLSDWQSIRVVGPDALQGPIADLQLAGMVLPSLNLVAIQRIAGQVGASHVVRVQALALGDSVALVATISSRDSPDEEERAIRKDGREEELEFVTAGLALGILGLHGESADYDDLLKRSPNHDAHQQFRDGQIALYDWRLSEAEEHFRAAIEQDSAFALAHHYLAQTLYWRTARDPERLLDLGPEIERHSRRALQYDVEGRLRPGERNHVQAFHAFWTGDFDEARTRYDRVLSSNPTDLEGLILRGSVEFEDPWLTDGPDGSLTPRLDLDLARAMYDSAANLNS